MGMQRKAVKIMPNKTKKRNLSKTQKKRVAYNYRYYYFKKYPGLIHGHLWFCSQCGKPLWNKSSVQVDHILALGAGGVNRVINTVAICGKCNLRKSDKVGFLGHYVVRGYFAKIVEVVLFGVSKVTSFTFSSAKSFILVAGIAITVFLLFQFFK